MTEPDREAFEKWAKDFWFTWTRNREGEYKHKSEGMETAWLAWQEATRQAKDTTQGGSNER